MSLAEREAWNERNRGKPPGGAEQFVIDMIPLLRAGGLVLDVAAGRGRHSFALARAGMRVAAVDFSTAGLEILAANAAKSGLRHAITPLVADVMALPLRRGGFDAVVNVNFLERALIPALAAALRKGGMLLLDTFLIDQAELGRPRDPRFLLRHYELKELLAGLELMRYREGLIVDPYGNRSWRAGALACRR